MRSKDNLWTVLYRRHKFTELKSIYERKKDQEGIDSWLDTTKVSSHERRSSHDRSSHERRERRVSSQERREHN